MIPFVFPLLAWLAAPASAAAPGAEAQSVPFVGCRSDGLTGPGDAPDPRPTPRVSAKAAASLAYYAGAEAGVLAPRGWHCLYLYEPAGTFLIVAPGYIAPNGTVNGRVLVKSGGVLLAHYKASDATGRAAAAEAAVRYFPGRGELIERMRKAGLLPGQPPNGKYPADTVRALSADAVAFTTPGGAEGEGSQWLLAPAREPIEGFVALLPGGGEFPDTLVLRIRLPRALAPAAGEILAAAEAELLPK